MLTFTQVWGALLIFVICPSLGALPLTGWITRFLATPDRPPVASGHLGVSAAFESGGAIAGILAILLEAAKGIGAVLLARHYFPADSTWEIVALVALVMGRYWSANAVGTTSVLWGAIAHAPVTAGLTLLVSFLGFTIFREKQQGRLLVLVLFPLMSALRDPDGMRILLTASLCGLMAWIYQKVPEDLTMPSTSARLESQRLFGFFQQDRALLSLDRLLNEDQVGSKAATLSQLTAWGYSVPRGYVLLAGDDPTALIEMTRPSTQNPVVVRASVTAAKPLEVSSAGQYGAVVDITSKDALFAAINQVFRSYDRVTAVQYRRDRDLPDASLAVIVQEQVQSLCGGVAFSRDPLTCRGDAVFIEAALGSAQSVVSGRQTPERYRIQMQETDIPDDVNRPDSWQIPAALTLPVDGEGDVPSRLMEQVAFLARHVEKRYRGIPQTIEWSSDGDRLWLLQSRPIIPPSPRSRFDTLSALPGFAETPSIETAIAASAPKAISGLPISPGQAVGPLVFVDTPADTRAIAPDAILIVSSLKAVEIPILAQFGGVIAEVGGQLSTGAIVAREYGIPAVSAIQDVKQRLQSGQRVRLNGSLGLVEIV